MSIWYVIIPFGSKDNADAVAEQVERELGFQGG
jgi:hypothetical protein